MWASSLVLLIGAAVSSPGHAQPDSRKTALARALFEDGVAAADRGDWVGATDMFGRAYSLKPTSGIAFNFASALIETGQLLHAQELLLGIERDPAADGELKQECAAMLEKTAKRIAHLRVHVPEPDENDARVEVDGTDWPSAAWDIASPIDPGKHEVVLRRGTVEHARLTLSLAEGESRDVLLESSATELATRKTVGGSSDQDRAFPPLHKRWIFWGAVGAVVAGGVVAAVVLSKGKSERTEPPVMGNATPAVLRW